MFIHGGGWVLGDFPTHQRLVRDLVVLSGFAAVFVDYTRTSEAPFPQANQRNLRSNQVGSRKRR
jgi:acetyl esterase